MIPAIRFYAPGIVNNNKWDSDNVKKLCGTEFETTGINRIDMDDWTSVYIYNPENLTSETGGSSHKSAENRNKTFLNSDSISIKTNSPETLLFHIST